MYDFEVHFMYHQAQTPDKLIGKGERFYVEIHICNSKTVIPNFIHNFIANYRYLMLEKTLFLTQLFITFVLP